MCLVFLTLLLAPRPAQAQWAITDQNGQPVSQNGDGSYSLSGPLAGTGTCTYPSDLSPYDFYDACILNPNYFPYLFNGTPDPNRGLTSYIMVSGWAQNNAEGSAFYWNGTTNEAINGTTTTSVSAPLTVTFTYTGTGTPPDHLDILVGGSVQASAWVYGSADLDSSALSAQVTASDGLGEDLSGLATPSSPNGGQSAVVSHLLHLPVSGGVAHVSAAAQLSLTEINQVSYWEDGAAQASGEALVTVTAQLESQAVMNIIPLRVDATTAHNSRVIFRVEPAGAIAKTVTFTAPSLSGSATSQTLSNVSGEFSCNFDEGQLPSGSSNFVLDWTPGDQYVPLSGTTVNVGATRTTIQATGYSPLLVPVTVGDNTPTGTGGPDSTIVVVPVTHELYEFYDKFSYSLPVVPESETIHVGMSNVNIQTTDSPVIPSIINGWGENHYYADDNGVYGNAAMQSVGMQSVGMVTLPAQTNYFQSKDAGSDLFFAPNHNLVGISQTTLLIFELDDSPQVYWPYFYIFPTIKVPIN